MQDYPKFARAVLMVGCGQCAESNALDPSVAFRTMRQDPGFQSMRATCTTRAKSVVERIFTCAPYRAFVCSCGPSTTPLLENLKNTTKTPH